MQWLVFQEKDVTEGKALQMGTVCKLVIPPRAEELQEPTEAGGGKTLPLEPSEAMATSDAPISDL